jgi:hypothetical protein
MTKIVEGTAPKAPIQELVGFEIVEAEEGRTVFSAVGPVPALCGARRVDGWKSREPIEWLRSELSRRGLLDAGERQH